MRLQTGYTTVFSGRLRKAAAVAAVLAIVCCAFAFVPPAIAEETRDGICSSEEKQVLQAARTFLDAELKRDFPGVYACFAPSSPYAMEHSYEDYLRQATTSPDRLVDYTIVGVSYIQENEDTDAWPTVEKFAQVEVDLVFMHVPTKQQSMINIGFVFFREGGRWYKS